MSFWNGMFAKHYDGEHPAGSGPGNFLDHAMANGLTDGYQKGEETVYLDYDPITMEELDEPLEATPLRMEIAGKEYTFFVPGRNPSGLDIKRFLEKWNRSKKPVGERDPFMMVSESSEDTYRHMAFGPTLTTT